MEKDLLSLLFEKNPYENFDPSKFSLDLEGWNNDNPLFLKTLKEIKPKAIIEIGVYKGASAIFCAKELKKEGIPSKIICVDTFLGWINEKINNRKGCFELYEQFIANVMISGVSDYIIPFPQTSNQAYWWLINNAIIANFIYIDGDHGFEQVLADIINYWQLLQVGGAMIGDDYSRTDVKKAVDLIAKRNVIHLEVEGEKWLLKKTNNISLKSFLELMGK